ncbi:MAG: EVE domain-containing protein, partial [Candidatus Binatia bacterium]
DKKTAWDGVKNNLALKHLSQVKKGDWALIYHTGKEKAAVSVARVIRGAYPDPQEENPRFVVVDIKPVKALSRPVLLSEMRANPKLAKFDLLRLSRLSVMPVSDGQWKVIEGMAKE